MTVLLTASTIVICPQTVPPLTIGPMKPTEYKGPYQFPFVAELKRTEKIQGVKVTVTAKLVVRGGWQNE